jgi:hypothetical protein
MTQRMHRVPSKQIVPLLLVCLGLLLSGCAGLSQQTCGQFDESRKDTDYSTQYQLSESESESAARDFKKLPRGKSMAVRLYKMRVDPARITPCRHLTIRKEMYLQRHVRAKQGLEEVREFYTDGGMLIATKNETIGTQRQRLLHRGVSPADSRECPSG